MIETNSEDLEWEVLQKPLTIQKLTQSTNLPQIPHKSMFVVVNRDNSYQIKANLT